MSIKLDDFVEGIDTLHATWMALGERDRGDWTEARILSQVGVLRNKSL